MFWFFKKEKKEFKNHWDGRLWFINDVLDAIRKIDDPNAKLEAYIDLHEMTSFWEFRFDIECLEMSLAEDDIVDAFQEAMDIDVIYTCARSCILMPTQAIEKLEEFYECDLVPHLKLRLLKCFINVSLRQELIDPRELDPKLQHAFYAIEQLDHSAFSDREKSAILERDFGITNWKSRDQLFISNGGIIDYF